MCSSDLTWPFIPETFKYEVIPGVSKQFKIVSNLLNRSDVDTIYVCTDSGREGEYIYRLVEQMAGVKDKKRKRDWIAAFICMALLGGASYLAPLLVLIAVAYLIFCEWKTKKHVFLPNKYFLSLQKFYFIFT